MAKISTEGWPVQILPFKSGKNFPISLSGHMVLVFRDDDGKEFHINAGPANESRPYGQLDLRDINSPLTKRFNVVDGSQVNAAWRGSTKIDFDGRDPEDVWDILIQHAKNIHNADIAYNALTKNSNAVIGTLLDVVGIDIRDFLPDPRGIMLGGFIGKKTQLNFDFSLTGTDGDDILKGRNGRQTFNGMDGDDHLYGGFGRDHLFGNDGRDLLVGGRGKDLLSGGLGRDELSGGADNDILKGGRGPDLLNGGKGRDTLLGMAGNDTLKGGLAGDDISGGADEDLIAGGGGHDILSGGAGADTLRGAAGNDELHGGDGDDRLKGGDGDDVLQGGAGQDQLIGGIGADTFVFQDASDSGLGTEADRVLDFDAGEDVIDIEALASDLAFAEDGFTGTGPSFYLDETGGNTEVQVDVDGDGVADMQIVVRNAIGLGEDDFIF